MYFLMRNSLSAWHRCLTVKCNMWEGIFQVSSSVSASLTSAITSFLFPPAPNPCAQVDGSSPCSHLCLINFNQTFSCACPHLMKLQPDKRTCKGQEETERPPVDPSKKPRLYLQLSFTAAVCEVVSSFFIFHSMQSPASSSCTPARSRSGAWTLTIPTTTTSSPSLCPTSTTWRWWTTTLWSTASTGPMSERRPSKGRLSTALGWRPSCLQVRLKKRFWLSPLQHSFELQSVQFWTSKVACMISKVPHGLGPSSYS